MLYPVRTRTLRVVHMTVRDVLRTLRYNLVAGVHLVGVADQLGSRPCHALKVHSDARPFPKRESGISTAGAGLLSVPHRVQVRRPANVVIIQCSTWSSY
jgi:hypothetical protein